MATHGAFAVIPLLTERRTQPEQPRGWHGQPLPPRLKADRTPHRNSVAVVTSRITPVQDEPDLTLKAKPRPTPSIGRARRQLAHNMLLLTTPAVCCGSREAPCQRLRR